MIDATLLPRFGECKLADINHGAVVDLDVEIASDGLSPSTRANVQVVLRSVLRNAVEGGMLEQMPRMPKPPKPGRTVVETLQPEELDAILAVAFATHRLPFALAAYAGLRVGETRALRWTDVDLKRGLITVRHAMSSDELDTPKSGDGRQVPIAAPLRPLLDDATKRRKGPWDNVALTRYGKPWAKGGLTQAFERARDKAGLEGWTFHQLRHFFITELCRRGAPPTVVQELAGHADLSTTQRYAHTVASDREAAIALFGT